MAVPQFGAITTPFVLGESDANNVSRSVTQTMLSDSVELLTFYRLAASRLFFFGAFNPGEGGEYGHEATHNFIFETVANAFVFTNETGYDYDEELIQYLNFTDTFRGDLYNTLFSSFEDSSKVFESTLVTASNSFSWLNHDDRTETDLTQYALLQVYLASNTLTGTEALTSGSGELFADNFFNLSEVVSTGSTDFGRGPSQQCIKDHVAFKITDGPTCPEKEFSPFVGASGDASYGAIDETKPTLVRTTLQLTHPRVSPTLTLTLKNPEFGNQDTLTFARIDRTTRGGERKIFGDNTLSKSQTFELTVRNLDACKVTVDQIVTFLNTSLGQEIGLRDWEGRDWKGYIVVPETEITQEPSGTVVTITFDGVLI